MLKYNEKNILHICLETWRKWFVRSKNEWKHIKMNNGEMLCETVVRIKPLSISLRLVNTF
jgi:alpha-L-arabinofuranosidase